MKIELVISEYDEYECSHEVFVDEKSIAGVHNLYECPEDAIIGRDLLDGNHVIEFIKLGYNAAKRGEELEVIITTKKDE